MPKDLAVSKTTGNLYIIEEKEDSVYTDKIEILCKNIFNSAIVNKETKIVYDFLYASGSKLVCKKSSLNSYDKVEFKPNEIDFINIIPWQNPIPTPKFKQGDYVCTKNGLVYRIIDTDILLSKFDNKFYVSYKIGSGYISENFLSNEDTTLINIQDGDILTNNYDKSIYICCTTNDGGKQVFNKYSTTDLENCYDFIDNYKKLGNLHSDIIINNNTSKVYEIDPDNCFGIVSQALGCIDYFKQDPGISIDISNIKFLPKENLPKSNYSVGQKIGNFEIRKIYMYYIDSKYEIMYAVYDKKGEWEYTEKELIKMITKTKKYKDFDILIDNRLHRLLQVFPDGIFDNAKNIIPKKYCEENCDYICNSNNELLFFGCSYVITGIGNDLILYCSPYFEPNVHKGFKLNSSIKFIPSPKIPIVPKFNIGDKVKINNIIKKIDEIYLDCCNNINYVLNSRESVFEYKLEPADKILEPGDIIKDIENGTYYNVDKSGNIVDNLGISKNISNNYEILGNSNNNLALDIDTNELFLINCISESGRLFIRNPFIENEVPILDIERCKFCNKIDIPKPKYSLNNNNITRIFLKLIPETNYVEIFYTYKGQVITESKMEDLKLSKQYNDNKTENTEKKEKPKSKYDVLISKNKVSSLAVVKKKIFKPL